MKCVKCKVKCATCFSKEILLSAVYIAKMKASCYARIETLHKDNYDTWKLQMKAVFMKNDAWEYVSGECAKPTLEAGNAASEEAVKVWTKNDN